MLTRLGLALPLLIASDVARLASDALFLMGSMVAGSKQTLG